MKKKPLFTTDYRLVTGYVIAFILLLISDLVTLYSNRELIKQTALVTHNHKVISDLDNLYFQVKDGVTGYRGFILTKDSNFLEPFYPAPPPLHLCPHPLPSNSLSSSLCLCPSLFS